MLAVNNILLGLAYVLDTALELYFWIVLIACVLTWVSANPYNPIHPRPAIPAGFFFIRRILMTTRFYRHWRDVPKDNWRWPNFSPAEIACRGTGSILIHKDALDRLRLGYLRHR